MNEQATTAQLSASEGSDKRQHERLPYTSDHRVAPHQEGWGVPPPDLFAPVTCHDISRGGFSFITDRLPIMPLLVLAMKMGGRDEFLVARIVNHREYGDGKNYVVGCKFTGRLNSPAH